ncbi:MAG: hypothetical protein VKK80_02050 [Prochlorothrix sp.]|nr:hypothetical protein [Prochlorothrix sp.]
MPHNPHDQFAKQFLEELLSPFGQVVLSQEVLGESRLIDLWFQPFGTPAGGDRPPIDLGLLGTLTQSPCLLEPYRNPPDFDDIRSCVAKRLALVASQQRQSPKTPETQLPPLWILTPTLSVATLHHCGATPNAHLLPGCYTLAPLLGTHLIILHQLPKTPATLWLRLLGRGRCQREAIQEVLALPTFTSYRDLALQLLANWKIALETLPPIQSEEEATLMALSQAYLEWEAKTLHQGEQRGIQIGEQRGIQIGEQRGVEQGQRQMLLQMLTWELEFKFGDRGLELVPYLEEIETRADLYALARAIKPLTTWESLQEWWSSHWEQCDESRFWLQGLGVALKLQFPQVETAAIATVISTIDSLAQTQGLAAAQAQWQTLSADLLQG